MSSSISFWNWLWGDWGKPTALTSLGVPKFVTNLLGYLLASYVGYVFVERYYPESKQTLSIFIHNPFIVAAYVIFYLSSIIYKYAENGSDSRVRRNDASHRRRDSVVNLSWVGFVCTLVLFVVGALQSRSRLK